MRFISNLSSVERAIRFAIGLSGIVAALYGIEPGLWRWAGIAAGAGLVLSAAAGYCPACAAMGRQPLRGDRHAG